ncbi:MAG: NAD-dependent epimerase/dehydratase family protein [Acidimicrobiales bacterium]
MAHHVVVGAGPVGSTTARTFVERGDTVTVVTRRGIGPQHPAIRLERGDATDATRLTELATGAASIVNAVNPPYHRWATDWPPMHQGFMTAAQRSGAVLVMMDNLYAFGPDAPMPMREDDPMRATGTKGSMRATMARELLDGHAAGRFRATLARASDFFGPEVLGSMLGDRVMPKVLAGKKVSLLGAIDEPHDMSYMPDVARTLVTIATDERAWGHAWHVPNPTTLTQRDAVARLARAAGTTVAVSTVPWAMVRLAGLFVPMMRELQETRYQFDRPFVADSTHTRQTFGLEATSWDEAAAATVAWWRARPAT